MVKWNYQKKRKGCFFMNLTEFIEIASQNVAKLQAKVEEFNHYIMYTRRDLIERKDCVSYMEEITNLWNSIGNAYNDLDSDYLDNFDFSRTFRNYSAEIIAVNGVCQAVEYYEALYHGDISTVLEEVRNEEYPWSSVLEKMINNIENGDFNYPFVREDVNICFDTMENDVKYPQLERTLDKFENLQLGANFTENYECLARNEVQGHPDVGLWFYYELIDAEIDAKHLVESAIDALEGIKKALEELENRFGDDYENQVELNNIVFSLGYDYESDVKRLLKE